MIWGHMTTKSPAILKVSDLLRNEDGNFAMMASILVPVMFVAGSLVLDTTNALSMKNQLQNAADSAALATTSQLAQEKITESEAVTYATRFFTGQISDSASAFSGFTATPTVTLTKSAIGAKTVWQVDVSVAGSLKTSGLARIAGKATIDVAINSTSESARDGSNPLSMMLVLDHSGSMAWPSGRTTSESVPRYCGKGKKKYQCGTDTIDVDVPKIDVLKEAVELLVAHIQESDQTDEYARMGAVAYNSHTDNSDKQDLTWAKSDVTAFTDELIAEGGTNSEWAMKWGYQQVSSPSEANLHSSMNGSNTPSRFIVFMTDGENSTGSDSGDAYADKQTLFYCNKAKEAGVTIFSVAFQAPSRGKRLLESCSSGSSFYYNAESAVELTKAFKDIGEEAVKLVTRLTK